MHSLLQVA
jgi:hypothetical protein